MKHGSENTQPPEGKHGRTGRHLLTFPTLVSVAVLIVLTAFVVQEVLDKMDKQKLVVDKSTADDEEALALRFEERGPDLMAAQAWIRYISRSQLDEDEKARLYYRIGKLFQASTRYDRALEFYYRSELAKQLPDIQDDLKEREQTCLANSGVINAVNREMIVASVREFISRTEEKKRTVAGAAAADEMQLATRLEESGVNVPAAQAWLRYMNRARLNDEEKAMYFYHVGTLYQNARRYERALENYYRSQETARLEDVEQDIKQRVDICLEALNVAGAGRTAPEPPDLSATGAAIDESDIVAEFGDTKITALEIEEQIEDFIAAELSRKSDELSADELVEEEKILRARFMKTEHRLEFLDRLISMKLLAAEAKRLELDTLPENVRAAERALLGFYAERVVEDAADRRLFITEAELKEYYDSHTEEFIEKKKARVRVIRVGDEQTAKDAIREIRAGATFEECARKYNEDPELRESGGKIGKEVSTSADVPGAADDALIHSHIFFLDEGEVSRRPVLSNNSYFVFKVEARIPERTRPFEEVRHIVEKKKRKMAEKDLLRDLIEELRSRENVIVHDSNLQPGPDIEKEEKKDPSTHWP